MGWRRCYEVRSQIRQQKKLMFVLTGRNRAVETVAAKSSPEADSSSCFTALRLLRVMCNCKLEHALFVGYS